MTHIVKFIKRSRNNNAFTLIEMLVVLVVVALLMAIIIPNVAGQRNNIEEQGAENIAEILNTQAETYRLVEGENAPVSIQLLLDDEYITQKQYDEAVRLLNADGAAAPPYTAPAN